MVSVPADNTGSPRRIRCLTMPAILTAEPYHRQDPTRPQTPPCEPRSRGRGRGPVSVLMGCTASPTSPAYGPGRFRRVQAKLNRRGRQLVHMKRSSHQPTTVVCPNVSTEGVARTTASSRRHRGQLERLVAPAMIVHQPLEPTSSSPSSLVRNGMRDFVVRGPGPSVHTRSR